MKDAINLDHLWQDRIKFSLCPFPIPPGRGVVTALRKQSNGRTPGESYDGGLWRSERLDRVVTSLHIATGTNDETSGLLGLYDHKGELTSYWESISAFIRGIASVSKAWWTESESCHTAVIYAHKGQGLQIIDCSVTEGERQYKRGQEYCIIEESEWVKTPRGGYLELVLKVIKGDREGLRFIDRLHLNTEDLRLQQQAYKRLSAYSRVTGVVYIQDSQQLHGIPFWVRWTESNELVTLEFMDGSPSAPKDDGPFTVEVLE
mgnify:CR=1 FL=1